MPDNGGNVVRGQGKRLSWFKIQRVVERAMSVHADWFDKEAAIIIMTFAKSWSTQEHELADKKVAQLSNETYQRFDIIVDYANVTPFFPVGTLKNWLMIAHWREATFSHWGFTVFVSTSPTIQAYIEEGSAIPTTIQKHCRLVQTVEVAIQLILDDRNSTTDDSQQRRK